MSKFVVSVFDTEEAAYKGSQAMIGLHRDGSIALYAGAVITKDENGNVVIKDAASDGPIGTATGMLIGTMVGALGGVAGAAAGASAGAATAAVVGGATGGALAGWWGDLYRVGVDGQFLTDVGDLMQNGKSAVVAEIEEGWTTPLDTSMEELGGTVHRRYRIDVEDAQIERDIEATERELEELEAEWDQAADETKAKLQAKVDATKERLSNLKEKAATKVNSLKEEAQAKIAKLDEQIVAAKADTKAKFEKARDQLKEDYAVRSAKLSEAAKLTREALSA